MLNQFFKDKSGFKTKIIVCFLVIVALIFGNQYMVNKCIDKHVANEKLLAKYTSEGEWLKNYNRREVLNLRENLLKPVTEKEVPEVLSKQLEILRRNGLAIERVSNGTKQSAGKGKKLKSVKTSITAVGAWENVASALSRFEKQHLVVITQLGITQDNESGLTTAKIDFNTYYR